MSKTLSSYETACKEILENRKKVHIESFTAFEFKRKKKDGWYAYINEPTSFFFNAPEITTELKDAIIDRALSINPYYARLIKKKLSTIFAKTRNNMHFDIVIMKVSGGKIVSREFIEVAGEQHFGYGIDDNSVVESIISDAVKETLWNCHIFDATKDTKLDFLDLFEELTINM